MATRLLRLVARWGIARRSALQRRGPSLAPGSYGWPFGSFVAKPCLHQFLRYRSVGSAQARGNFRRPQPASVRAPSFLSVLLSQSRVLPIFCSSSSRDKRLRHRSMRGPAPNRKPTPNEMTATQSPKSTSTCLPHASMHPSRNCTWLHRHLLYLPTYPSTTWAPSCTRVGLHLHPSLACFHPNQPLYSNSTLP